MTDDGLPGPLEFVRDAERLNELLRSAHTSQGSRERTAEHTWPLRLPAIVLEHRLAGLDLARGQLPSS